MSRTEATVILVVALLGMLTALPLPLGGSLYVPFFVLFVLTGYLFVRHGVNLSQREILFLVGGFVILVANLLCSGLQGFAHQLKALLQIMAGLGLAVFIPQIVRAMGTERLAKVLGVTLAVVMSFAVLERLGITRDASDAWRQTVLKGSAFTDAYTADARDLEMVGYVRPKVFAPEPAYLAGFVFVCLTSLSLMSKRIITQSILALTCLAGWFIIGSPVLLLALVSVSLIMLLRYRGEMLRFAPLALLAALFLVLRPPASVESALGTLESRFSGLLTGDMRMIEDASVRSRVYVPFAIGAPAALDHNLLWGMGIGGKERLSEMLDPNYSRYSAGVGSTEHTLGTNALGSMLATLGLLGFALLLGLVIWYWWPLGWGSIGLAAIPVGLFLFTRGAYETQSFWMAVFLMPAAVQVLHEDSVRSTETSSAEMERSSDDEEATHVETRDALQTTAINTPTPTP